MFTSRLFLACNFPSIGGEFRNAPANNSRQWRLAGVAVSARLNGLRKTPVRLPGLAKHLLVLASYVPLPWALFLPLDEVNAKMVVVATKFATLAAKYNLFWAFFLDFTTLMHYELVWLMP
jgi:hypothetical protein